MILLATELWPALVSSLLLGAGIGLLTGLPRTRAARMAALLLTVLLGVLGGIAASGLVPGRAGSWIEIGALVLGAYLVAAATAAAARRTVPRS